MIETIIGMSQSANPFLIIISGLLIGLMHAFEPDHISAVSTQLLKNDNINSKKHYFQNLITASSLNGMFWGMGHTSSIVLVGLLIAVLSLNISDNFFIGAEIFVGFMLIFLGIFVFKNQNIFKIKHIHPHRHSNGISHTHIHSHNGNHKHGHKAYLIGLFHGVAGSGSIVALVASTVTGIDTMIYFLMLFGMGSIIGMTITGGVLGLPIILLSKKSAFIKYLRCAISGIALIFGVNIIITVVINNKLFLS